MPSRNIVNISILIIFKRLVDKFDYQKVHICTDVKARDITKKSFIEKSITER